MPALRMEGWWWRPLDGVDVIDGGGGGGGGAELGLPSALDGDDSVDDEGIPNADRFDTPPLPA